MACRGITFGRTVTSSALVFLILLQTILVCDQSLAAPSPTPAKKNDILAGSEFLSVFINGAMAPRPTTRRRLSLKRGGGGGGGAGGPIGNGNTVVTPIADSLPAESKNDEANIYRISRVPITIKPTPPRPRTTLVRDDGVRYYPISHKVLDNRNHNLDAIVDDLGRPGDISSKYLVRQGDNTSVRKPTINIKIPNQKLGVVKPINQKVIGVSVTSSVEATPYKVRVEHNDPNGLSLVTSPPPVLASTSVYTTSSTQSFSTRKSDVTNLPARLVTEELNNIVSESNRSEFTVDEGVPRTSLRDRTFVTPKPIQRHHTLPIDQDTRDSAASSSNSEPVEQRYEFQVPNSEMKEVNHEMSEVHQPFLRNQGRKVGRHFDESSSYNQPTKIYNTRQNGKPYEHQHQHSKVFHGNQPKVYNEPAKVYGQPSQVYGEPSKVYGEPSKVYGEPSKVYGEPSKVYGEPEKVYSQPSQVYSEPSKVYSEPSKVYGEPSKVYDNNGHPVGEPEEKNYEVDEAVSVGSNGNVHGPQGLTEASNIDEDGHKIGYVYEGRNFRKYRVEERTPDGFIVGEYGVVSHDDGSLRGVRYTADGTINPKLIYDALMKFLSL